MLLLVSCLLWCVVLYTACIWCHCISWHFFGVRVSCLFTSKASVRVVLSGIYAWLSKVNVSPISYWLRCSIIVPYHDSVRHETFIAISACIEFHWWIVIPRVWNGYLYFLVFAAMARVTMARAAVSMRPSAHSPLDNVSTKYNPIRLLKGAPPGQVIPFG